MNEQRGGGLLVNGQRKGKNNKGEEVCRGEEEGEATTGGRERPLITIRFMKNNPTLAERGD